MISTFSQICLIAQISLIQVTSAFQFSVIKDGKDDVAVSNVEFYMTQQDSQPSLTTKYACEGFSFKGECKVASLCTYKFAKCAQTVAPTEVSKPSTPAPANAPTTTTQKSGGFFSNLFGSGSSSTTTTPATTTTAKATTRPPFRSTSG